MTDAFNDSRQQNISLEDVRELPMVFERVMESQKAFNLIDAKARLLAVGEELWAMKTVITDYQQQLAEKVIKTGTVDHMDQSRGVVLMTHQAELIGEIETLTVAIERALEVQKGLGHRGTDEAILSSIDSTLSLDVVEEFKPLIPAENVSEFTAPIEQHGSRTTLELDLPPFTAEDIPVAEETPIGWNELGDVYVPVEVQKLFKNKRKTKVNK
jgi:hypothetical protein